MMHIVQEEVFRNYEEVCELPHFMMIRSFSYIGARIYQSLSRLEWPALLLLVAGHMGTTFIGLSLLGEIHLVENFVYYYLTTASTIGYGDLAPLTDAGRLFAAIWIFMGAFAIFTITSAKIFQWVIATWRRRMDGFGNYSKRIGQTVIIGYDKSVSHRIFKDLLSGGLDRDDIIVMHTEMPSTDLDSIAFVLSEDLARPECLRRASIATAKQILIMAPDDDATVSAALAVAKIAPHAHIVVAIECETRAGLIEAHTHATCVVSQSPEVIASELLDPGVSAVLSTLSSASKDVTAFAVNIDAGHLVVRAAHRAFRSIGMTFLGFRDDAGTLILKPADDVVVTGSSLYYIGSRRVDENALSGALFAINVENI